MGRRRTLRSFGLMATLTLVLCIAMPGLARFAPPSADLSPPAIAQTAVMDGLTEGRSLYGAGRYGEAAIALEQAAAQYGAQGDTLRQAIALSNLCLTYQQLGRWSEAETAIATSVSLLQSQPPEAPAPASVLAQVGMVQGQLQRAQGQSQLALATWEQAEALYRQQEDFEGQISSQINQAQALQDLGFYQRAIALLRDVTTALEQPDSLKQAIALRSLGDALLALGQLGQAEQTLQQSLAMAQRLGATGAQADIQISLGNTYRAQAIEMQRSATQGSGASAGVDLQTQALTAYGEAIANANTPTLRVQALLNQLRVLIELERWTETLPVIASLEESLDQLPLSRTSLYHRIDWATSLIRLNQAIATTGVPLPVPDWDAIAPQLLEANQQAVALRDQRAQTYALGSLAHLYEITGQWELSEDLTRQALVSAQGINASEILYRWEWQLARILQQQGDREGAIASYQSALTTLKSLRRDLASSETDPAQFSFRERVEPFYREFVALILDPALTPSQTDLEMARQTIEALQLAELDNFFREACLNANEVQIDQVDRQAAVVYPIILGDRLEVIVTLPQPLSSDAADEGKVSLWHHRVPIQESDVRSTVNTLQRFLTQSSANSRVPALAAQVYDWLVRPVAVELQQRGVKTLVFVPDGVLRNIPMTVLYDGTQYLIEHYSVALTPGLQLLASQPLRPQDFSVLMGGVSEAQQGFSALPNVVDELETIRSKVPGRVFLNQEFTNQAFQTAIDRTASPIVHIATHGQFSSDVENTFILTWQNQINIPQLNAILQSTDVNRRRPIELLVLSACETARGDDRAALGLAGVAVRAGARSTMATLWIVNDESTALLMSRFYDILSSGTVTKAEALRQAQLSLLNDPQYERPYFWSPVVLIGNWL